MVNRNIFENMRNAIARNRLSFPIAEHIMQKSGIAGFLSSNDIKYNKSTTKSTESGDIIGEMY